MAGSVADVVIVGYGGSGAMAAIAAHDAGARVVVIEKMPDGGGSTQEAGGSLRPPRDPVEAAVHYAALSGGSSPLDVMETLAQGEVELPQKLAKLGARLEPFQTARTPFPVQRHQTAYPHVPGASALGDRIRVSGETPDLRGGESLWNLLSGQVRQRGIDVLTGRRGHRLLRDGVTGRVTGIEVVETGTGKKELLTASGGVVLACGGFNYDSALKIDYLGADIGALSPPGRATGDGIRMAAQIGADLWHMNAVSCAFGYRFPGHEAGFYAEMPGHGYFVVDQHGRRYCNEASIEIHSTFSVAGVRNYETGQFDRIPSYIIFDETTRTSGKIFRHTSGYNRHFEWSADNSAEIERGWIKQSPTFDGLAAELGLPADAFSATAAEFEAGIAGGRDQFGRDPEHLAPVSKAPYYGLPLWPCLLNTQGGPVRDRHARVLDPAREPIEGLFSAGELGSVWGALYPGSGNVAEAIVFGDIAGRNAAQGVG